MTSDQLGLIDRRESPAGPVDDGSDCGEGLTRALGRRRVAVGKVTFEKYKTFLDYIGSVALVVKATRGRGGILDHLLQNCGKDNGWL